ncbi:hypothetical protein L9F63_021919, partial [Diploptera punctata]
REKKKRKAGRPKLRWKDRILHTPPYRALRLFGNSGACSACGQTIPASEFVMRAGSGPGPGGAQNAPQQQQPGGHHVFHLKCFACSKCGSQLMPGDRYCLLAGSLVCEQDWHKLLKGSGVGGTATGTGTVRKGKVGRPRRSRDLEAAGEYYS